MKHILIIIIVLFLIITSGYWTLHEISVTAHTLLTQSASLEESINNKKWDLSQDKFKNLKSTWNKAQSLWTILLNHTEIDNIDIAMAKIEQYIKTREQGLALGEISSLKWLINHIPEKEKLTPENIF